MSAKTWLDKHKETLTAGQRIADAVATAWVPGSLLFGKPSS
jgi:hypothetical protein